MSEKLYGIIARVMDIQISEINDNSSPETIPNWDSFNSYILLNIQDDILLVNIILG